MLYIKYRLCICNALIVINASLILRNATKLSQVVGEETSKCGFAKFVQNFPVSDLFKAL